VKWRIYTDILRVCAVEGYFFDIHIVLVLRRGVGGFFVVMFAIRG